MSFELLYVSIFFASVYKPYSQTNTQATGIGRLHELPESTTQGPVRYGTVGGRELCEVSGWGGFRHICRHHQAGMLNAEKSKLPQRWLYLVDIIYATFFVRNLSSIQTYLSTFSYLLHFGFFVLFKTEFVSLTTFLSYYLPCCFFFKFIFLFN